MSWPGGRLETSCLLNCGQSPPEITATFTTASSPASSAAISDRARICSPPACRQGQRQSVSSQVHLCAFL